ncbi:MAG: DUF2283 domain-containing protein [Desulfoferrobacter sp.]
MGSDFNVFYDEQADILYLGKSGQEEEVVELAPGVNVELDERGKMIGLELLHASLILKDIVQPLNRRLAR